MNNPLFSVLMASYNNGRYIEEAVKSIKDQTYTNWEIVIVDDFSTDNSKDIYKILEQDSRIKIFYNEENKGCGYTKRKCIEVASGEICGFLDPDDAIDKDSLRLMVEAHVQNPTVALAYSKTYICDEHLNVSYIYRTTSDVAPNNPYFFNFEGNIFHFSSFKKSFYNKTEGIDAFLQKAVDYDLYLKLYEVGNTLFLDTAMYYYRIHKGGISNNLKNAHFWYWIVITQAAKRRNIRDMKPVVELFHSQYISTEEYYNLYYRFKGLKKYEKLNNFLSGIKTGMKNIFSKKSK